MSFNKEDLTTLRKELPKNFSRQTAQKLGLTVNMVNRVLRAESYNPEVIQEAIFQARQKQEQLQQIKQVASALST